MPRKYTTSWVEHCKYKTLRENSTFMQLYAVNTFLSQWSQMPQDVSGVSDVSEVSGVSDVSDVSAASEVSGL